MNNFVIYCNYGEFLRIQNKHQEAKQHFLKAKAILKTQDEVDYYKKEIINEFLGILYFDMNQIEESDKHFNRAKAILEENQK